MTGRSFFAIEFSHSINFDLLYLSAPNNFIVHRIPEILLIHTDNSAPFTTVPLDLPSLVIWL